VGLKSLRCHLSFVGPDDVAREAWAREITTRLELPMIASARPYFITRLASTWPTCSSASATRRRSSERRSPFAQCPGLPSFAFGNGAHLSRCAERLSLTVEIAKACTFSLGELEYSFPCDDIAPAKTADDALRRLVGHWAPRRYREGIPSLVATQLEKSSLSSPS